MDYCNRKGMFSTDKSVRETSFEKLKFISGAQVFLGVGIFVCFAIAVTKEHHLIPYLSGGFTCGIAGTLAGIGGIFSAYKDSFYNGVVHLRKELQCTEYLHMLSGLTVFFMSFPGFWMNILFLVKDDDEDNEGHKTHVILSACMLSGIVLLLPVTFLSFIAIGCCEESYNRRVNHANYPNTVGGTQYYQGQSPYAQKQVYTTGGYNPGSNPPPYSPPTPSFGIGQNPTQYGVQPTSVPTAPPPPYSY